ncbi:hypothetical protein GP486_003098 [Trichoglossum hirsutum]|uniref:DUF6594 domain-containing protein n=1 Tax=Trichoglossum hirsutum TaxID=265104 RepID=A0A9P8RRI4_9PEZI|nr:hypothetical protein GP486_003098 [Trichoglossum hirsutum]
MYRAFGTLRNEIILHRQLKIGMLEERLQKMNVDGINRNQLNDDLQAPSEREKLIDNIDKSLQDYDKLLEREARILQREKPTARNQQRFLRYICRAKPIFDVEMGFTRHADDFVTLTTRKQDTWTIVFFKGLARRTGSQAIMSLFERRAQPVIEGELDTMYYSPSGTRTLLRTVITLASVAFLMIPFALLLYLGRGLGGGRVLGIIAIFQVIFASAVASFTRARPHEIFGVTLA